MQRMIQEWHDMGTTVERWLLGSTSVEMLVASSGMPGPRTVLIAGQHGDEAAGPLWLLGLGARCIDDLLAVRRGQVTVIRCANPEGLRDGRRWLRPQYYMDSVLAQRARLERDPSAPRDRAALDAELRLQHDMNRRWNRTSPHDDVEELIWRTSIPEATQVIDLHVADTPDPDWQARVCTASPHGREMVLAESLANILPPVAQRRWYTRRGAPESSLLAACSAAGIPAVGVELPAYCDASIPAPEWAENLYGPCSMGEWNGQRMRKLTLPEQQAAMPTLWSWLLEQHR